MEMTMKKLTKSIAIIGLPFAMFNTCLANSFYAGLDYARSDIEISSERANPGLAALRFGYNVEDNIAIEGQYLFGLNTDNVYTMEFDIEQSKAIYVLLQSPDYDGFRLDVALGYASTTLAVTGPDYAYVGTDDYNDFSWGVSLNQTIPWVDNLAVKLGYQSLYKDSYVDISAVTLGLTYAF